MLWKRIAKIAAGILGVAVVLIGATAAGGYTSADFRSRVESETSAYSSRKTKIEKISVDWGTTAHVHLAGVNIANADWGKTDRMFKADEIDFDISLWPLLKGDIVLPSLVLHKPHVDLLDLHGPVAVEGKIRSPQVSLGRSLPIPTPVFGNARNVDCSGLIAQLFSGQ